MPPDRRPVPRFAADLARDALPEGDWADTLRDAWLESVGTLDDVGEVDEVAWYPERGWSGRAYVPATARTSTGLEVFGFVAYLPGDEPGDLFGYADATDDVAEDNPDWTIDICEEVIGSWRGEGGARAQITLVWGRPLVDGATVVTAELGGRITETVDQCPVIDGRFSLVAPDDYRGDTLSVVAWDARSTELARESLYDE